MELSLNRLFYSVSVISVCFSVNFISQLFTISYFFSSISSMLFVYMRKEGLRNCSQVQKLSSSRTGRSSIHDGVHSTFTSLLNVVASEDNSAGQHLMSMNSQAMATQRIPLHIDHREYERQQKGGRVT